MSSNWISYDIDALPSALPSCGGCYAIFGDDVLVYVGEAENVRKRVSAHDIHPYRYSCWVRTPWGEFSRGEIRIRKSQRYADWAMIERRLIRRLRPSGNIRGIAGKARRMSRA